jgi:glycosyltransferase involved in cell wall biosynthesis
MKKIVFYDDSPIFGGHEITAIEVIKILIKNASLKIYFIADKRNIRLIETLTSLKHDYGNSVITIYSSEEILSLKSVASNLSLLFLIPLTVLKLAKILKSVNPSLLIAVQGTVFSSFLGILAAKKCDVKVISFIPMGIKRSKTTIKTKISDDILAKFIYSLPESFITIAKSVKVDLIHNGVKQPIKVIYYGIDKQKLINEDRKDSRDFYQIESAEYVMAVVGRIEFTHKAQDFLVESLLSSPELPKDLKLYVVGDGPDLNNLISIVNSHENGSKKIVILPWTHDLSKLYSAIDMLVIPSWREGLPIVMLEAMHYNLPIVASNIDGMAEILTREWLFECGDKKNLIETIIKVMNADNTPYINRNKALVLERHNLHSFTNNFYHHIIESIK